MLTDPKKTKDEIVQWIRDYFNRNGKWCQAVVGISGGKDSTIVAGLLVEALGADRVVGVLMPNGYQSDIEDSVRVLETLGIKSVFVNIDKTVESLKQELTTQFNNYAYSTAEEFAFSKQANINLPARIRMATLYAVAQSLPNGGRVANTCNMSEDFVGYSTKFGDSAGDFSPLAHLLVSEVRQIGHELPIPADLIDKTPSDGLCGKSDEDNLGFTYAQLEQYIVEGTTGDEHLDDRIAEMHDHNLHKLDPMPAFLPYWRC